MSWTEKLGFKLLITGLIAALAWYAQQHSITVAQFNAAFASIPLAGVGLAVAFDYGLDTGKMYSRMLAKTKNPLARFALATFSVLVFFVFFTWVLAGTITLNLAVIAPEIILAAGVIALLMLLPNTGTTQWAFWIWVAMQLVTAGKYLTILPAIGGV